MRLDNFDFAGASALLAEMSQRCARAGRAGRARRAGHRAAARLHALCRAGARDHGAAAGARSDRGRCGGAARDIRARIFGAVPPPDPGRRDRGAELVGADLDAGAAARARMAPVAEKRAPSPDGSRVVLRRPRGRHHRRADSIGASAWRRACACRARRSSPRTRPRHSSPRASTRASTRAGCIVMERRVDDDASRMLGALPPPCGEGLGMGVMRVRSSRNSRPPLPTLPRKGEGERTAAFAARKVHP